MPDQRVVDHFMDFVHNQIDEWHSTFERVVPENFEKYLSKVDSKKKKAYINGHREFCLSAKLEQTYSLMQKSGEFNYEKRGAVRPRNLFNPGDTIKAIMGQYNHNSLRLIKKNLPQFIHGLSTGTLEKILKKKYEKVNNPTFLTFDGS